MAATGDDVAGRRIEAARQLAPRIRACADEVERERRLPRFLFRDLQEAGLFRLWLPTIIGGDALDPLSTMRLIEELAHADGSVGWCVMVAAQAAWSIPELDQAIVRDLFHADDVFAGTIAPGSAVAVEGGYRATGRSPFASGCTHATWLFNDFLIMDGEQPRRLPDGTPERRRFFFPSADCEIVDTWHTTGLRGSGSHDVVVTDSFVPSSRVSAPLPIDYRQRWGEPLFRGQFVWPMRGALALGIARHAVDSLVEIAPTKKPFRVSQSLRDLPRVQAAVARAEAALASVRAYLYDTVVIMWDAAVEDRQLSSVQEAQRYLATAYTAEICLQVVEEMFRLAGATAIRATSPLERCFRDVNTLMADQAVAPRLFEDAGRIFLGSDPPPTA